MWLVPPLYKYFAQSILIFVFRCRLFCDRRGRITGPVVVVVFGNFDVFLCVGSGFLAARSPFQLIELCRSNTISFISLIIFTRMNYYKGNQII